MRRFRWRGGWIGLTSVLLLGGSCSAPPCRAAWDDTRWAFARHLLEEDDTFRAITVLKEMAWTERDSTRRRILNLALGEAYRKSGRPERAAQYYEKALRQQSVLDSLDERCHLGLSLAFASAGRFELAEDTARQVRLPEFQASVAAIEALVLAERGDYSEAARRLRDPLRGPLVVAPGLDEGHWASRLDQKPPTARSPALAALLSAAAPGAGQLYAGHVFDAAQAFFFVGAFSVASIAAHPRRNDGGAGRVTFAASCTLTGLFHAANVLGAHRTARYRNLKLREDFIGGFRAAVLSLDF